LGLFLEPVPLGGADTILLALVFKFGAKTL
jgi:hypothetical protein